MKEKKSSEACNKVTMFPGASVDLENTVIDDTMDEALRESIKREADELEARLNNDPAMKGIGASDDMFDKIVASLKEMGVWEEEEEESNLEAEEPTEEEQRILEMEKKSEEQKDAVPGKTYEAENQSALKVEKAYERKQQGGMESENSGCENQKKMELEAARKIKNIDLEADAGREAAQTASKDEIGRNTQNINFKSKIGAKADNQNPEFEKKQEEQPIKLENSIEKKSLEEKSVEKKSLKSNTISKGDSGKNTVQEDTGLEENGSLQRNSYREDDGKNISISETAPIDSGDDQGLEAIYKLLPEEDRLAMELGHRVNRKNEKKKNRRKKRSKFIKYAGVVAASVVIIFGAGMTSEANRRLVSQGWNSMMGSLGIRMSINYVDVEKSIQSRSSEEYQALQEVQEKIGSGLVYLKYLPEGMEFSRYEIQTDWNQAMLFYICGDTFMTIQIIRNSTDRISYVQLDGANGETEFLENDQEIEIKIQNAGSGSDEAYIAEFERNNCNYVINGSMPYTEMKKIAKNLFIFSE